MDSHLLVSVPFHAGQKLLAQLARDAFEVKAAFWAREVERDEIQLNIVHPPVDQEGLLKSLARLQSSLFRLANNALSLADLSLIGVNNPLATDVLGLLAQDHDQAGIHLGPRRLGDHAVEWAYIYPERCYHDQPDPPTIPEAVFRPLLELIARGSGPFPPSRVMLRDGSSFEGVPTALSMEVDREGSVQFLVGDQSLPRSVSPYEIVAIR